MTTQVYGCSDDLIEFDGDIHGEVGCYGHDEEARGVLLAFSDGTLLVVKYCGKVPGVWAISLLNKGSQLLEIDQCADPDANPYSDVARFSGGLKWCYASNGRWEKVA